MPFVACIALEYYVVLGADSSGLYSLISEDIKIVI